jgi:hypothetical protein
MLGYAAVKKIRAGKTGEMREVVYSLAWQGDDPIVQLPLGATHEQSYSMMCGISETQTRELTRSLAGSPLCTVSYMSPPTVVLTYAEVRK